MAQTINFGIKLTADGSGFVGNVEVSRKSIEQLGASARKAGEEVARGQRQAASESQRSASIMASAMSSVRTAIIGAFSAAAIYAGVKQFVGAMVDAQREVDKLRTGFQFAFGSAAEGARQLEYVRQTANRLGQELNTTARAYVRISAAARGTALEGEGTRKIFEAINSAAAVLGLSVQETEGAFLAVGQMISKGTVQAEELRGQLGERLPGAFQIAARAMGVTTQKLQEMLEKGEVVATDFLPKLADELQKAFGKDAEKAVGNLQQRTNLLANSFTLFKQTMAESGIGDAIASSFTVLAERIDGVTEAMRRSKEAGGGFFAQTYALLNTVSQGSFAPLTQGAQIRRLTEEQAEEVQRLAAIYKSLEEAQSSANADEVENIVQVIGHVQKEIEARQQLIDKIKGQKKAHEDARSGAGTADTPNAFENFVAGAASGRDAALKYAKQYLPDTDKFRQVEQDLRRLYLLGQLTKEEFDKAIAGADEQLNKSLRASMGARISAMEQQAQLTQAQAQASQAIQKDQLERETALLEFYHSVQLVDERSYIDRREQLQRAAAEGEIQAIQRQIDQQEALRKGTEALTPRNENERTQQRAKLADIEEKLLELTTRRTLAERALGDAATKARQSQYQLDLKIFDAEVKIGQETADYLQRLKEESDEGRFQLSLIGQTAAAQRAATAERQVRLETERKVRDVIKEIAALEDNKPAGYEQSIISRRQQIEDIRAAGEQRARDAGQLAVETENASQRAYDLGDAWRAVDDTLYGVLDHMKEGWQSAAKYAREQILKYVQRTLYELTLQKFAINLFSNVTGAGAGTFAGTNQAANFLGGGGSGGGSLISAGLGFLGGGAGVAAPGMGFVAGAESLMLNAGIGAGATSAIGGAMSMIGAALPYVGIALAIYSMFAKPGGGPKGGGSYLGSYDTAGRFTGTSRVEGSDNGRFFTPSGSDQDLRGVVTDLAGSYFSTLTRLGGTAPGGVQFGLGFDTDPEGTAPNRISSAVTVGGRQVFGSRDRDVGRDESQLQAELKLEASRSILAALQASDLPDSVARIINSLDVRTATQEAIDNALAFADVYQQILTGGQGVAESAQELYEAQTGGAREAARRQGEALVELARRFDGSTSSAQQLAQAQAIYRQSLVELLASIHAIQEELSGMFAQTRERIQLAGLSDQETYDFYQQAADQRFSALLQAQDPAEVQRLAGEINGYFTQAFDLLSPEDQLAHKQEFLDHLSELDEAVNRKLGDLATAISEESEQPFKIVGDTMKEAATKMATAVDKFDTAVDRISNAAANPPPPTVIYVGGSGPSEVSA